MREPWQKKALFLCSLSDPPTMAGIIVLGMTGGHDERVERGGRGRSEAVRSGRHSSSYTKTTRNNALASPAGGARTRDSGHCSSRPFDIPCNLHHRVAVRNFRGRGCIGALRGQLWLGWRKRTSTTRMQIVSGIRCGAEGVSPSTKASNPSHLEPA